MSHQTNKETQPGPRHGGGAAARGGRRRLRRRGALAVLHLYTQPRLRAREAPATVRVETLYVAM